MKSATIGFHEMLQTITDADSAESMLPKLEESHHRLAVSVQALDEAELTSSRSARNVKREITDFKKDQKAMLKVEFDRLKSDKFMKAILEPFLRRINAF
jgi:hypothetical protein